MSNLLFLHSLLNFIVHKDSLMSLLKTTLKSHKQTIEKHKIKPPALSWTAASLIKWPNMFSSVGNWVRAFHCSYTQQLFQKYPNWILCLIAIHFCASYAKLARNLLQVSWIFGKHLTGTWRRPTLTWMSQIELGLSDVAGKNKFNKIFLLFYCWVL